MTNCVYDTTDTEYLSTEAGGEVVVTESVVAILERESSIKVGVKPFTAPR